MFQVISKWSALFLSFVTFYTETTHSHLSLSTLPLGAVHWPHYCLLAWYKSLTWYDMTWHDLRERQRGFWGGREIFMLSKWSDTAKANMPSKPADVAACFNILPLPVVTWEFLTHQNNNKPEAWQHYNHMSQACDGGPGFPWTEITTALNVNTSINSVQLLKKLWGMFMKTNF